MWRKSAVTLSLLIVAFGILFTSVLRTAAVKYEFTGAPESFGEGVVLGAESVDIKYNFAYPGKVLPDSPFWFLKALRDKVWLSVTTNSSREAELKLLFADKRMAMSKILFEREKYEVGYSILTKAEKYLEEASDQEKKNRESGVDTTEFLRSLALASLKHRQVIDEILIIAPEDAKPGIIETKRYSKIVYEKAKHALQERGLDVPENPFEGE